jgi:hypothetical protein
MNGSLAVCFALLIFSGLLRPWARNVLPLADRSLPGKPRPDVSFDRAVASPITLSSIELALIAELSLERARDNAAIARDVTQRPETRQTAAAAAMAWRERARILHLEASRRTGQPMAPQCQVPATALTYSGPERRRQLRRRKTRRGGPEDSNDASGSRDRRTGAERRGPDRRRPEAATR